MFKKSQIYFIAVFVFVIIILALVVMFSGRENPSEVSPQAIPVISPRPSTTQFQPLEIKPILTREVPMNPVEQGGGVNLGSSLVEQSQSEVAKIKPFLPYQNGFLASSQKTVTILIPGAQYQETPWVLDVQIFGINYQVSQEDEDYNLQRESFLTAAANVFDWIKANGADPEKIIINWGDRAFIRAHAEEWLSQ